MSKDWRPLETRTRSVCLIYKHRRGHRAGLTMVPLPFVHGQ